MPRVSVVIPAYNAQDTIANTVRSVQRQTLADIEVVVVDDGSTDDTLSELERVGDRRLTVCTGDHRGVAAARDLGLERSTGEFVSFLDADDLWTPDKLERQVAVLDADPALAVAYSWTIFVDDQGRFLFAKEPAYAQGDVYLELATHNFLASGSNALGRRRYLDAVGGFDERFSPAEDWEYWLRVAARSRFAVVPHYQVIYRFRRNSRSTDVDWMESGLRAVHGATFSNGLSGRPRQESESLANLVQYTSFLHLVRTSCPGARRRAGRLLGECLRTHPRVFWTRKVQLLMLTWLATLLLPPRLVPRAAKGLLGIYGSLMRAATPALRRELALVDDVDR